MDWLCLEVSNLRKKKLFRVWLFREWQNYTKALHMVTIREYKEFCARRIIVTALQKHISQLKNNCQDTFYFYSLCRRSERQFLVVQMHFLSIWALWLLLLLKYVCKKTMRKSWTDPSWKELSLLKDCGWTSFCLSWPTLHTLQIYIKKRALYDCESQTVEYLCCLHTSDQQDYSQTVFLLVAYASYQHLLHLYSRICMTNYCRGKLLLTPERVRET